MNTDQSSKIAIESLSYEKVLSGLQKTLTVKEWIGQGLFWGRAKTTKEDLRQVSQVLLLALAHRDRIALLSLDSNEIISIITFRLHLQKSDDELKKYLQCIHRHVDLEEFSSFAKTKEWWWSHPKQWPYKGFGHKYLDRYDTVWRLLTLGLLAFFVAGVADIVPRLFAGGPSLAGSFTFLFPVLLTWIIGKEPLQQVTKLSSKFDKMIETSGIYKPLRNEAALLAALFLALGIFLVHTFAYFQISSYYYYQGMNKTNNPFQVMPKEKQDVFFQEEPTKLTDLRFRAFHQSDAESDFQRSVAFNPEHIGANSELGWHYEKLSDLEKAKKSYLGAVEAKLEDMAFLQTQSLASMRLVGIQLNSDKPDFRAAWGLLLRAKSRIFSSSPSEGLSLRRSFYVLMAQLNLKQLAYNAAYDDIIEGFNQELNLSASTSSSLFCVAAELLDTQKLEPADLEKLINKFLEIQTSRHKAKPVYSDKSMWIACYRNTAPDDIDDASWRIKARQKLTTQDIQSRE